MPNCLICTKSFNPTKAQLRNGGGKYCSYQCYWLSMKGKAGNKKGKIGFTAWNKGLKGGIPWNKNKTLSKEHIDKIKATRKRGLDNPNYKGSDVPNKLERNRFREAMQKKIFERDDYTCQFCGTRGGDLQVDHIQSWADYVELRFSMDNCRTLCAACHYQITFGKPMPSNIRRWGHNLKHNIKEVS